MCQSVDTIHRMKKTKGTLVGRAWVVAGLGLVALGVAGFLGWPRPFDPDTWWVSPMFCALGSLWIWRGLVPGGVRARKVTGFVVFVVVSVLILANALWPL